MFPLIMRRFRTRTIRNKSFLYFIFQNKFLLLPGIRVKVFPFVLKNDDKGEVVNK